MGKLASAPFYENEHVHAIEENYQLARIIKTRPLDISLLAKGSFFGDYQILLNLASSYDFIAYSRTEEIICMNIDAKKFLEICNEFPEFHTFLSSRGL